MALFCVWWLIAWLIYLREKQMRECSLIIRMIILHEAKNSLHHTCIPWMLKIGINNSLTFIEHFSFMRCVSLSNFVC